MVAVISGPDFWSEIQKACKTKNQEIIYQKVDRDIDIISEVEKISTLSFKYLILDIACLEDPKRVPHALRKLKMARKDFRMLLISPTSFSGSEVISNLISMGVYDIIGQKDFEDVAILPLLLERFDNPATYAMAVKWDNGVERRREKERQFIETGTGNIGKKSIGDRARTIERDKIVGTVVISVAGTMPRIGTTHTAISIARYLMSNRHGVAVVELHNSNNFNALKDAYENVVVKNEMFSLAGIDFYPYDPTVAVSDLILDDYGYVILDMGVYSKCNEAEFKRANERIIVSGVKDWELDRLEELIETEDKSFKNKFYFTFSDEVMFEFVKSSMAPLSCFKAPYNPQPFEDYEECAKVFEEMLKGVLPQSQEMEENTGLLEAILKKKEVKLYHKPILMERLRILAAEEEKSKLRTQSFFGEYSGILKFIFSVIVAALILTLLYYVMTGGLLISIFELFE